MKNVCKSCRFEEKCVDRQETEASGAVIEVCDDWKVKLRKPKPSDIQAVEPQLEVKSADPGV